MRSGQHTPAQQVKVSSTKNLAHDELRAVDLSLRSASVPKQAQGSFHCGQAWRGLLAKRCNETMLLAAPAVSRSQPNILNILAQRLALLLELLLLGRVCCRCYLLVQLFNLLPEAEVVVQLDSIQQDIHGLGLPVLDMQESRENGRADGRRRPRCEFRVRCAIHADNGVRYISSVLGAAVIHNLPTLIHMIGLAEARIHRIDVALSQQEKACKKGRTAWPVDVQRL